MPPGGIRGAQVRVLDSAGREVRRTLTDDRGAYDFSGLPDGTYRIQVESRGFRTLVMNDAQVRSGYSSEHDAKMQPGEQTQTVTVTESAPLVETTNGTLAGTLANLPLSGRNYIDPSLGQGGGLGGGFSNLLQASTPAAAEGQQFDDLYEYKLKDRVTIRKNQSAMVPIVQSEIRAEKISLWTADRSAGHPLRGVWLSNNSGETLDGGNFSVIDDEIFAGQGLLEPIKPDERRLVSYATDLAMLVRVAGSASPQRYTRVLIGHGVMIRMGEGTETKTYTIRNEDSSPRTLIVEHPFRPGWTLSKETLHPEETTASNYRFRVAVGPRQSTTLEIKETYPMQTQVALSNITSDEVTLLLRNGDITPEIERALRTILDQKDQVADLKDQEQSRDSEIAGIYNDQTRLRENLKALKGTPEEKALTQRYTQQLSDQETRLEKLRSEKQDLAAKRAAAQEQLNKMVEELAMETTLEAR
jgi:hypothetical protein